MVKVAWGKRINKKKKSYDSTKSYGFEGRGPIIIPDPVTAAEFELPIQREHYSWFISTWQMLKLFPSEWNSFTWFIWSFCLVWHKWVRSLMSMQMKKSISETEQWWRELSWSLLSPSLHAWMCVQGHIGLWTATSNRPISTNMHKCFVSYSATGRIDWGSASVAALRLGANDDSLSPLRPWHIHATRTAPITVTLSPPCLYTSPV